ncbi:helix-turn-helix transcriptional regulator [Methylococcus capsulatus]|uniref:helix-turn-helix transcriptional regulator n=1 Tax=Methylococcus capsulatus TaxID=414 RepID=UPI001C5340DC|nr:hypothetical protein [Methylococcus capsulatus]QXP89107.1 hypothetical protein KW114_08130 [Methylococcus capsulatus]
MTDSSLIPISEAGKPFKVTLRTIQRWQAEEIFPRPIPLGGRKKFIPKPEIDAIYRARLAEKSVEEIRQLVRDLHAKRAKMAAPSV